jgi:hypothetical protein
MGGISVKTTPPLAPVSLTTTRPARLGRVPAPPVALPEISFETGVIADWLKDREGPQRRPEQTARVLALAVVLHLHPDGIQCWPVRRQVSTHTGVSLPMLDVVMSQRQANGDISVWTTTVKGNINRSRESSITQKFVQPSKELIDLVKRARRNAQRSG